MASPLLKQLRSKYKNFKATKKSDQPSDQPLCYVCNKPVHPKKDKYIYNGVYCHKKTCQVGSKKWMAWAKIHSPEGFNLWSKKEEELL